MKQIIKCLSKFKNWAWRAIKTNINQVVMVLLRASFAFLLIIVAFYLFFFTNDKYFHLFNFNSSPAIEQNSPNQNEAFSDINKNNIVSNPLDQLDNGTLLAMLSVLIAFAGLLAYIFHYLVKDSIHKELKTMAHDERLASKADMRLATSNIFSKLYELTEKIEEEGELLQNKDQLHIPCKVHNAFKSNRFLDSAIMHDKLATQLTKKITNANDFKGTILKVLNNRGYNIYLKYKRWEKLIKDSKEDDIKKLEEDINVKVSDEEIQTALKAKYKLRELIASEDYYLYEDITPYHIKAWKDTCAKIDALMETSPKWKKIQDEMHNYKN